MRLEMDDLDPVEVKQEPKEIADKLNEAALKFHGLHSALVDAFRAVMMKSGHEPMEFEVVSQWMHGGIRTYIRPKQEPETEQQRIGRYIGCDPGFWRNDNDTDKD